MQKSKLIIFKIEEQIHWMLIYILDYPEMQEIMKLQQKFYILLELQQFHYLVTIQIK